MTWRPTAAKTAISPDSGGPDSTGTVPSGSPSYPSMPATATKRPGKASRPKSSCKAWDTHGRATAARVHLPGSARTRCHRAVVGSSAPIRCQPRCRRSTAGTDVGGPVDMRTPSDWRIMATPDLALPGSWVVTWRLLRSATRILVCVTWRLDLALPRRDIALLSAVATESGFVGQGCDESGWQPKSR